MARDPNDWRNDFDWTDPNDAPVSWDEYENTQEIMTDQGIPMGQQVSQESGIKQLASGIRPEITIEEVVKEFIRKRKRKPTSFDEIKEFYFNEMGTAKGSGGEDMRMAAGYPEHVLDEYESYKINTLNSAPEKLLSIDDWYNMEYESSRAGVQSGGLAGILGV